MTCFYCNKQLGYKIADYYECKRDDQGDDDNRNEANPQAVTFAGFNGRSSISLVVSAASYNVRSDCKLLRNVWESTAEVDVIIGDGSTLTANFEGYVDLDFGPAYGK